MITLYRWGENGLYAGSVDAEETDALPSRSTSTKPPKLSGTQVARWTGDGWEKLASAPAAVQEQESAEAIAARYEVAVQGELDQAAKARGYDSLFTAISYADEPAVPRFQADGQVFRRWRSLVWDYAHTEMNAVLAGEKPQPELDAFLASLPPLVFPT